MSDSEEAPVATNHHSDDSDDFEMDSDSDVQMSDHYRESGILISIVLVNFMCHKHMRVDFGPNVNFIYGPNGSGKSAILVGLQTCFGTRANETNRAGSMRDLIRDGQSEGSVTVRLANKGNGAYQHETFGDWIDVKRTLKAGGGASYRISNQWNKKEDSKRATLDAILGHFQIQITNPCIIMTQDTSREFLQSKEHKDKYNFFLRATLLEQIREENDKAYKAKGLMELQQLNSKPMIDEQKAKVDKVTKRLEEAKDMESLKQEIKETVAKGAWASVVEAELVLDEAELEASKATKIFEKFLEKQQKIEGKLEELTKLQEEHDLEVQAVDTQLTSLKSEARQAKDKEKTVKAVANKAALKVKGLKSKMQPKQKKLKSVEENLNEALRDSKADVEKIQATLQKKIDKLMKKRDDAQAKITSVAEEEQTAKKEYEDLNNRHRSEEKQLEKYRHEVRETQDQIRQIQEAKKDALLKFGNHCPNVHKMIQQNLHKFEVPPLGPLGKYVELKDSHRDWGVACENQINKLQAYLVDNVRDYTLLAQIVKSCFKGHGQFPMIVTSKKTTRVHQNLPQCPDRNLVPLIDVLVCDDPWVMNILIDQCKIERTMLLPNREAGYKLIETHGMQFSGVMQDGTSFSKKGSAIRVSSNRVSQNARRLLGGNDEDDTARLQENLKMQKNFMAESHTIATDSKTAARQADNKLKELKKSAIGAKRSLKSAESAIKELEEENPEGDVDAAEELIAEYKQEKEELLTQVEDMRAAIAEAEDEATVAHAQHKEALKDVKVFEKKASDVASQISGKHDSIRRVLAGIAKYKSDKKAASKKEDELTRNVERFQDDTKVAQEKLTEVMKAAQEIAKERPDNVTKSGDYYLTALNNLNQQLDRVESRLGGDLSAIVNEFKAAEERLGFLAKEVSHAEHQIAYYDLAIMTRNKEWKKFRKHVAQKASKFFTFFLAKQGHEGELAFDDDKEELVLKVNPNASSHKGKAVEDTKSLSGGERSFSTLAFILALGESISAPFRVIDEFDVYMDSVNRALSMKLLAKAAQDRKDMQFIFITPQDITSLAISDSCRLKKLKPVDRHQRTLTEMGMGASPDSN